MRFSIFLLSIGTSAHAFPSNAAELPTNCTHTLVGSLTDNALSLKTEENTMPKTMLDLADKELYVVTASNNGQDAGMIVTWISQASLAPNHLRIIAIFSPQNRTTELIMETKEFIIHQLAEDQVDFVPQFGLSSSRDTNKFKDIDLERTISGLPIIPNTCGWMHCKVISEIDAGDRIIYLADVVSQKLTRTAVKPLKTHFAFSKLPDAVVKALDDKFKRDSIRDAELTKNPVQR